MKLKIYWLITLIVLFATNIFAQTDSFKTLKEKKTITYIIAGGGWAIPMCQYASTNGNDIKAGFAMPGYCSFIEAGIKLKNSNFGFAVNISNSINGIDYDGSYLSNGFDHWASNSPGAYNITTMLGGVFISFPIKRLSIHLKGFIGFSNLSLSPLVAQSFTYGGMGSVFNTGIDSTISSSTISTSFTIGGSIALKYTLSKNICIFMQPCIIYTEPQTPIIITREYSLPPFNGSSPYYQNVIHHEETIASISQPLSLFNLNFGLCYVF